MDGFKISPSKVNGSGNVLVGMAGEIRIARDSVESVRMGLRGKIIQEELIGVRLRKIADRLEELDSSLEQYGNKAIDISSLYQKTEGNLVGLSKEVSSFISGITEGVIAGTVGGTSASDASRADETPENEGKEHQNSISWKQGSISADGKIGNIETHGEMHGDLAGASYEKGVKGPNIEWNEEGELKSVALVSGMIAGEAHVASGSVKGNIGLLNGSVSASVGKVSGKGEVKIGLVEDGMLNPQIAASARASAVGAEGKVETYFGTENNNIYAKTDGKLGYADAHAGVAVGKVTYENEEGETVTGYGVSAEVGAEAYAAQGSVKGGFEILGIKFEGSVTGKAGGAGVKAGGGISTGGVEVSLGAGLGLGLGLDVNIDWSGFKLSW